MDGERNHVDECDFFSHDSQMRQLQVQRERHPILAAQSQEQVTVQYN